MEKELQIGSAVVYVDEHRERHAALITTIFRDMGHPSGERGEPGANLVFVTGDDSKSDPYGRQIERRTSVCHLSVNPAKANCWAWPDQL